MTELFYGIVQKVYTTEENKAAYSCEVLIIPDNFEVTADILAPINNVQYYPKVNDKVLLCEMFNRTQFIVLGVVHYFGSDNLPAPLTTDSIIVGRNFIEIKDDTTINITLAQGKTLTINVSGGGEIKLGGNTALALENHTHTITPPAGRQWGTTGGTDPAQCSASSSNTSKLKGG